MPQPGGGGASGLPYAASPAGIGFEVRIIIKVTTSASSSPAHSL